MGGEQNGGVLAIVGQNGVEDVVPGGRVHSANGLIQEIEGDLPAHHQNELNLLLVSFGEGFQPVTGVDAQTLQHIVRLGGVEVAIKIRKEMDQFLHPHPIVEVTAVGQIGDGEFGLRPHRLPLDGEASGSGGEQAVA